MRISGGLALTRTLTVALFSTQPLLSSFGGLAAASNSLPQRSFVSSSKMSKDQGYVSGDLTAQTSQRIQDAVDLFSAKPSHNIFKRSWSPHAIFEDPICYAVGERQYKAQWWGMPALFGKSELLAWHVQKDEPSEIRYVQTQRYVFKYIGYTKDITSTVVMQLDHEGKIIHFQDRWNHQGFSENFITMPLRRLNALTVPFLISVPPEEGSTTRKGRKDL